jgi:DNA-binding HxlR family transcriptional regulator
VTVPGGDEPTRSALPEPRIPDCPLARAVRRIGDWRTLEMLHEVFDGHTRPADIQRNLQLPDAQVAERLSALVERGFLECRPAAPTAGGIEYTATSFGRSLRPLLLVMAAWGNDGLEPHERGMILVDARTGEEAEPVVVDRASGRRLDTEDYVFAAGPAASPAMRARYPKRPRPAPPG